MQTPEGNFKLLDDLIELPPEMDAKKQLEELEKKARELEASTGKPHPVFEVGEEVEIKGGKFRVHKILRNRLMLKPIKY